MNFTKEYIKEADCKEIQGLSYNQPTLDYKGYFGIRPVNIEKNVYKIISDNQATAIIWLPTGDQLDDEIVKICKERKCHYVVVIDDDCTVVSEARSVTDNIKDKIPQLVFTDDNPLIAKILLLKKLLEETND